MPTRGETRGLRPHACRPAAARLRLRLLLVAALLLVGCGSAAPTPLPTATGDGTAPTNAATPAVGCATTSISSAPPVPGRAAWQARTFYEVFVRSFADSGRDGIGDLRGLTARLDRLAGPDGLGVGGLWLLPIMPSPSYHGYDVTDYEAIRPEYGTLDDLRALVAAAHQRGLKVILDLPINHTSDRHPWFQDSRRPGSAHADWYVWSATPPSGPNWYPAGSRWYYATFGPQMPDLNLREPGVTAALVDAARFWLTQGGVDGFRLDAAKALIEDGPRTENTPETKAWLAAFTAALHATQPEALVLGEVWDVSDVSAAYVPSDLDMTFDFGLASAERLAVESELAGGLASALADSMARYPAGGQGTFLANHDMDRLASDLGGDPAKLRLAAALLLTGPGIPFLYYGEEIGMSGAKPDERIRTPMRWDASAPAAGFSAAAPWEPLSDDPATVNVAAEAADPASLWSWYRQLIGLRNSHAALATGGYLPVRARGDSVLAELRAAGTERLLVVANLAGQPVVDYGLDLAAGPLCDVRAASLVLGTGAVAAPAVTAGGGFAAYRPLAVLPARSVIVVALRP